MNDRIIELVALATGLAVIGIETIIIFLLERHIKFLDQHMEKIEDLMGRFEGEIDKHLEHLHTHSHGIEERLNEICETKIPTGKEE